MNKKSLFLKPVFSAQLITFARAPTLGMKREEHLAQPGPQSLEPAECLICMVSNHHVNVTGTCGDYYLALPQC